MAEAFLTMRGSDPSSCNYITNSEKIHTSDQNQERTEPSDSKWSRRNRGVILFPMPFQGHINPMLQLANILHAKGFSITIIHTRFNSPNPSNYPHFRFCSISDGLPEDQVVPSNLNDIFRLFTILNSNCLTPFSDCLSKLVSSSDMEDPTVCLVTDVLWYFTQAVANGLKVPRIVIRTSNASSMADFISRPSLPERSHLSVQDSPAENQVPDGPSPQNPKDNFTYGISDQDIIQGLLASIIQATNASSGFILNSCEYLEQEAIKKCSLEFPVPLFTIGPFHKYFLASSSSLLPQDRSCISWLDKQAPNSVIYVSIGSVAAITETEFLEVAWGLADSKHPFLWVVRPGSVCGSKWLEPLPEGFLQRGGGRGLIVKWAPQQEVLAHPATGGFWTHCGWNSTLESLCEGVPVICQPSFGDQGLNARLLSHVWKVGVHLEDKIERGEIEKAIKRLMVEAEGQEMRDRIKLLKEKMNHCLKPGGSSYKSLDNLVNYILSL